MLTPGTRLGPYEVVGPLGAGGMGEVYRAIDARLDRTVAIKILAGSMAADSALRERFAQEARSVAALNHPNICTLHDVGRHGDVDYLVMEFLDGETLAERVAAQGPLPLSETLAIARQVLDALDAAHRQGIIHRDLKPANIFLVRRHGGGEPLVKVLDFGLASRAAVGSIADTRALQTMRGTIVGTVQYMSPEQIDGRPLDARADLFSFGAVLFEMLTGRRAFEAPSMASAIAAVLHSDPPPLTTLRADVPPAIEAAVGRLLAKEPDSRWPSAADVRRALERTTSDTRPAAVPARRAAVPPTVAVLPFTNLSPDPDNEFFTEGLADEIIADLSCIRALRVISRSSAARFKATDRQLPAVAAELGVRFLLEGSVRRAGSTLRVTAQLVDAQQDTHIWAQKFSGTLDDVFGIQEEISRQIVDALKVQLSSSEDRQLGARPIADPRAYDCYLRARQHLYEWTPDGLERAAAYVRSALDIVGDNALLRATEGFIEWMHVNCGIDSEPIHLDRADACARHALALDPECAEGMFVRGIVAALRGRLEDGIQDLLAAHERRPGDANVLTELGRFLFSAGQTDAFRASVDALLAVDPLSPVCWLNQTCVHTGRGEHVEAIPAMRRMLSLANPASPISLFAAWQVLVPAGERAEGRQLLEQCAAACASNMYSSLARFLIASLDGDQAAASAHMTMQVQLAASSQEHLARVVADAYAQLGQPDDALRWLRASVDRGMIHYPFFTHDVLLDPIRHDPRFQELMASVKRRWEAFPKVTLEGAEGGQRPARL